MRVVWAGLLMWSATAAAGEPEPPVRPRLNLWSTISFSENNCRFAYVFYNRPKPSPILTVDADLLWLASVNETWVDIHRCLEAPKLGEPANRYPWGYAVGVLTGYRGYIPGYGGSGVTLISGLVLSGGRWDRAGELVPDQSLSGVGSNVYGEKYPPQYEWAGVEVCGQAWFNARASEGYLSVDGDLNWLTCFRSELWWPVRRQINACWRVTRPLPPCCHDGGAGDWGSHVRGRNYQSPTGLEFLVER